MIEPDLNKNKKQIVESSIVTSTKDGFFKILLLD